MTKYPPLRLGVGRRAREAEPAAEADVLDRERYVLREIVRQTGLLRHGSQQKSRDRHLLELAVEMIERALQFERDALGRGPGRVLVFGGGRVEADFQAPRRE